MTPSTCSTCQREVAVGIQNVIRIGSRWILWRLCVPCFLKEQRAAA